MGGVAFIGIVYLLIAALKELVSKESRLVVFKHTLRVITTMFVVFALSSLGKSAATQGVIIIDRKDSGASYTYAVPGYSSTNGKVDCSAASNVANCNASSSTVSTPSQQLTYQVRGATLSLRLSDGRIAIVNCNAKVNWTEMNTNTYRSCRIPLVDKVEAEFDGDKVKLKWSVSIDGKKLQSETYKILAVLDKP
jgi:hypothetical protein